MFIILCIIYQEIELGKKRPLFIKAKEATSHVTKRLEATK